MIFSCTVPGRVGIKKNSKRVFGRKVLPSERYMKWEVIAKVHVNMRRPKVTITGPLYAELKFYFKNHSAEPDTSNCVEGIMDVLESCGVIENDKQIMKFTASKHFGEEPRTEVELFNLEELSA